jgi:hypothetical protein
MLPFITIMIPPIAIPLTSTAVDRRVDVAEIGMHIAVNVPSILGPDLADIVVEEAVALLFMVVVERLDEAAHASVLGVVGAVCDKYKSAKRVQEMGDFKNWWWFVGSGLHGREN